MYIKPVKQLHNGIFLIVVSIIWAIASVSVAFNINVWSGLFVAWLSGVLLMIGIDIVQNHEKYDSLFKGDYND